MPLTSRNAPSTGIDALTVAGRLRPVILQINRQLRRESHELGLSATQISLMAAIRNNPGVGHSDLAAREQMRGPTLSVHIDQLEEAGLVRRLRDAVGDRRRIGLEVTGEGLTLLETVRSRRTAWLASRLESLTPDELAAIDAAIEPLRLLLEVGSR